MFNIEEFYRQAHDGEQIDVLAFGEYIKGFQNLVIWGAGNLGTTIGKNLIEMGYNVSCFWDVRAKDIGSVNGINVMEPFTGNYDKDSTIVVIGIVNGSVGDRWSQDEVLKNGYTNFLLGMSLYEGLMCPFRKGDKLIYEECLNNTACSLCNCRKYIKMIEKNDKEYEDKIIFQTLTLVISRKCTLKCAHCGQRLKMYPKEKIVDFPLERIKQDVDAFFDAVDVVGTICMIGGEPFIHPNIVEIVKHCLTKKNFGALVIATNGICKITSDMLNEIKDERVKISFSDYTKVLSETQVELFNKNVEVVKNSEISYSIGVPLWSLPATIENYNHTIEQMTQMKRNCESKRICCALINGKYIPCSVAEYNNGLECNNFKSDYVNLVNNENLHEELGEFLNKPYYESCRYCSQEEAIQIQPGEQEE